MMNRFSLSNLAAATMVVSVGLMVGAILTVSPTPSQAAKGGKGGGGGQPPIPAKITFLDAVEHQIQSDIFGLPYVDGAYPGLEVTIDSAANQGNIRVENSSIRELSITVPDGVDECGFTPGPLDVDFQFLLVGVDEEVDGGVFGLDEEGGSTMVPMLIRFGHGGSIFFLRYRPGGEKKHPCKGSSGLVNVVRNGDKWTVTDIGDACVAKHPFKKNPNACFSGPMNFSFDVELLP